MALTRIEIETIIIERIGGLMEHVDFSVVPDGANAKLNGPIAYGIRRLGGSVASVLAVADTDIATVSSEDYDHLLDLVELRTLENVLGELTAVDLSIGDRSESFSQLATRVERKIARLKAQMERDYGAGLGTLTGGSIALDFVTKDTDTYV